MTTSSHTPVVVQARVHPRRRHRSMSDVAEENEKPVDCSFSAPMEKSEVRRRFVGIYEQAYRIAYRSE
ncbi:hypothetical protein [Cerasicoccus arenae]|uniref:Uncharacterized protein n=1 Tax=Cerasicoccus arenae TaxID=424488 RepID=A0A8J3D6H5_9BACT|nr:hypothetical protein [Cerasicoccus arenae]MBK1856924.1 hypothetical protein [Cerasicoccus arenae]GHB89873.1 hypothetical protein GCM10007047_00490 [Cerasicoccus arenae]